MITKHSDPRGQTTSDIKMKYIASDVPRAWASRMRPFKESVRAASDQLAQSGRFDAAAKPDRQPAALASRRRAVRMNSV